ncbi:MAG: zinc-binding dehydrogenase [Bacteroidia bacterium]
MKQADWKEMFKAVQENDADLLLFYIQQGIDLDYQHPEYFTSALIESVRLRHSFITKTLLENGASPEICEVESGKTAGQIARELNNTEAMNLLAAFSSTNLTQTNKQQPLSMSNQKMKAVICAKYGAPEVLQIQEVVKPIAKDNEILVKIKATAVNSGDARVRGLAVEGIMKFIMRLVMGFSGPRKQILGTVYAGIVESVGKNVSNFKAGDKVFGMTGFDFGTYAEYIVLKESGNIAIMPQNASFEEAVSLIFGGQTVLYFFDKIKLAEMKKPKMLIIGATGSVGTAALQIAKAYQAEVTAVCSSKGRSLVESLGVSNIVCYDTTDFTQMSEKFDVIFDAVGKTTQKQCQTLLAKGGIYKTVGGMEYASESQQQLETLKTLFEQGKYRAVIDRIYPFEQIVEAHRYVDTGRKKGNVVLKMENL